MSDTLLQPQPARSAPHSRRPTTELPAALLQDLARRLRVMGFLGAFVFFMAVFFAPIVLESESLEQVFARPSQWLPPRLVDRDGLDRCPRHQESPFRAEDDSEPRLGACDTDAVWTLEKARDWWNRNN